MNGSVSGPITMPVDLTNGNSNYIRVNGSTAGASTALAGVLTNPNNLLWTQAPNGTLLYSNASIPLTLTSDQLLAGASRYGLYDYVPTLGNNGIAQELKLGVVASPANQISALITALNTSFFQNATAFLGSPVNPTPNMWYGGVWSRGGGAEMTTETTSSGGGALSRLDRQPVPDQHRRRPVRHRRGPLQHQRFGHECASGNHRRPSLGLLDPEQVQRS